MCTGILLSIGFGSSSAHAQPISESLPESPGDLTTEEAENRRNAQDPGDIFNLTVENDLFANEDNDYTSGFRLSWMSAEDDIPHWLDKGAASLPFFTRKGNRRYGFALGQTMFTPSDISRSTLDPTDRPYAGWLYGSVGLITDTERTRMDTLQLTLGMVGPSSLAEQSQRNVHKWIDSPDPKGWDNQLRDEPGIILTYQRKWKGMVEFTPFGLGMDISPHVGASLGNIHTHASTGAMARIGFDLPSDYGPPLIQPNLPGSDYYVPTRDVGWYAFVGVEGRAVARNIFLDGNTFRSSHSVDKEIWVGDMQAGLALTFQHIRLAYTHVWRTREFEGQDKGDEFGAVTVSIRF